MAAAEPSRLRAAIFDLGGTLVEFAGDGETWWDTERRAFLRAHRFLVQHHADAAWDPFYERIKRISDDYWKRATAGEVSFVVDHLVRDVCAELDLPPTDDLVRGCVDAFCAEIADACWPFEDALDTLRSMRERGLRIGLVSNTMIAGRIHREDLRRFGLLDLFDDTIFSGDVGVWKPDARIYRRSLDALGVAPAEAFFVGDRVVDDVGGARAAGLRGVLKLNERTDNDFADPRAAAVVPDARIRHLSELIPLIDGWLQGTAGR